MKTDILKLQRVIQSTQQVLIIRDILYLLVAYGIVHVGYVFDSYAIMSLALVPVIIIMIVRAGGNPVTDAFLLKCIAPHASANDYRQLLDTRKSLHMTMVDVKRWFKHIEGKDEH